MALSFPDNVAFDASAQNYAPETLSLAALLRREMRQFGLGLRVAMPARIERVRGEQLVDVQPLLQVSYQGQPSRDLPPLTQVPVINQRGADYAISLPIAQGDLGLLLVCDRNLDSWLAGAGQSADPQDTRAHSLNDAVFLPGLYPDAKQTSVRGASKTDLVLINGDAQVRLEKNGTVAISNKQNEVVDLLTQLVSQLSDTQTAVSQAMALTPLGPAPLLVSDQVKLQAQSQKALALLKKLQTFHT